ncbi:MAG: hypothetical protein FWC19_08565 [Treponema sp.]|nr:hypothetical protein [Treponema sp.]
MDSGQVISIVSQLSFGAFAVFLAIMLWPRTRDTAWMLIIIGVIVSYIEIVYSILGFFGMGAGEFLMIGSVPAMLFILPLLRTSFFIAGLLIMVIRQYRNK